MTNENVKGSVKAYWNYRSSRIHTLGKTRVKYILYMICIDMLASQTSSISMFDLLRQTPLPPEKDGLTANISIIFQNVSSPALSTIQNTSK